MVIPLLEAYGWYFFGVFVHNLLPLHPTTNTTSSAGSGENIWSS